MPVPESARVVVIGAGIVGNSVVHHLARLGWRDIVQIDKGPLPDPGGSTGHASNFIFPIDHSRAMADLMQDSMRQYRELDVLTECGGFEVARTPERMEELRRRMTSARAWGIEAEMVGPEAVAEKAPFVDTTELLGAVWTPSVSVVDSVRAGTLMREAAEELGALTVVGEVEVTGMEVLDGAVRRVRTDAGDITTDTVVIACGVWSPRLAEMAGASIPLTPAVHQMVSLGPVPQLAATGTEIGYPIIRDMDSLCYERQHGDQMEIGSYAHRAILHDVDEIPSNEEAELSPTEMPFTAEDFEPQLQTALALMPDALGADGAEVRYAINGLLSLTPDGKSIIGQSPEVRGLWSAAAVWIREAPGVGRALAELMTDGASQIDLHHSEISRFHAHQRTREHVRARTDEAFIKTYGIIHPGEQYLSDRGHRLASMHDDQRTRGAQFYEAAGWERPHWYASNESLLADYGDAVMPREHEWDARWWSPIINAEHLAMRERAGIVDLSAFAVFDVAGPDALEAVQRTVVAQADVPVGGVVYTPVLDVAGGFRSDLTVMRLADDRFRVVTGGAHGMADLAWFAEHARGLDATVTDHSSAWATIGLWGPRARDILSTLSSDDLSHEGFRFATCRAVGVDGLEVLASRISYVGEQGWELHVPQEQAGRLWGLLHEAGGPHGAVPVGIGVYGTTGRIEKGYRAFGFELDAERTVVEAGMQRPRVKAADFTGRAAYLEQRDREPDRVMCTLAVEDHTSADGSKRYMLGGEPVLATDGSPLVDPGGKRPYVTTAGSAPSLGKHLLMAYLPPEQAVVGTELAVSYMEQRYPVSVVSADATPAFDPQNERIRS